MSGSSIDQRYQSVQNRFNEHEGESSYISLVIHSLHLAQVIAFPGLRLVIGSKSRVEVEIEV